MAFDEEKVITTFNNLLADSSFDFWSYLLQNDDFMQLYDYVLADLTTQSHPDLVRSSYLFFLRIVTPPDDHALAMLGINEDWQSVLESHKTLTLPRTVSFAKLFLKNNPQVTDMIGPLLENQASYFQTVIDDSLSSIKTFQKRCEKSSKRKSIADPHQTIEFLVDFLQLLHILCELGYSNIVFTDQCINGLVSCYVIANHSILSLISQSPSYTDVPTSQSYGNVINTLNDSDCTTPLDRSIRSLKRSILALLNLHISSLIVSNMESLCTLILSLSQKSQTEPGQRAFLMDAPLILDLELQCEVSKRVREASLNSNGETNERVEYLLTLLTNIVTYTGSLETQRLIASHNINATRLDVDMIDVSPPQHNQEDELEMLKNISAVHDVFPEWGDGFIEALLAAAGGSEAAIMCVLEDRIPPAVQGLDRFMQRNLHTPSALVDMQVAIIPKKVDEEMNHDEDRIKNLNLEARFDDAFTHHIPTIRNETLPSVPKEVTLSLYNQYEDEYDDTYDSSSALDTTIPALGPKDHVEERLVDAYNTSPSLFHQSMRRDPGRMKLINACKMSHEQFEGWYAMLIRNPNKMEILGRYQKGQEDVKRMKWAKGDDDVDDADGTEGVVRDVGAGRGNHSWRGGRGKNALQFKMNKGMGGDRM